MSIRIQVFFDRGCKESTRNKTQIILSRVFKNVSFSFSIDDLLDKYSYDEVRGQYDAVAILDKLSKKTIYLFLGIVNKDIFVDALNFVFGVAYVGKGAVISTFRLRYNADESLFFVRLEKTIKHELGHVFGLSHCNNDCVMRFANSLYELDLKPINYCDKCYNYLKQVNVV